MELANIIYLFEGYKNGTLSDEELHQFEEALKNEEVVNILKDIIANDYVLSTVNRKVDTEGKLKQALQTINAKKETKVFKLSRRFMYRAAASVAILLALSYPFVKDLFVKSDDEQQVVLELSDGTQKILDTNKKVDSIIMKLNSHSAWVSNGKLNYDANNNSESSAYNTLSVPYGKTFYLALSDGSEIYLNAGSSLRYPVSFVGKSERKVFLTGEGFFKVSKNPDQQFIVASNGMETKVIGTEFNVSAYDDDDFVATTLVEGIVNVVAGNAQQLLKVNEEVTWYKNGETLNTKTVNATNTISWITGEHIYDKVPFKTIVKKMQRAYNVNIKYNKDKLDEKLFTARFKDENIEEIISYFADSYGFEYKVQGSQIVIE